MKAENILGGLDICCVRKPEKNLGGQEATKGGGGGGGGRMPPCAPLNATLLSIAHSIAWSHLVS